MGFGHGALPRNFAIHVRKKKVDFRPLAREKILDIDRLAVRYGKLPSEIKNDSLRNFQFNVLVANIGIENEIKEQKKAAEKARKNRTRMR